MSCSIDSSAVRHAVNSGPAACYFGLLPFMPGAGLLGTGAGTGQPGGESLDQAVVAGRVGRQLCLTAHGLFCLAGCGIGGACGNHAGRQAAT